ncbi:hypothetical protein CY34DRAFT_813129, partial [Suillus luteus UH-Slu-Lm8-n1]
MLEGLKSSTSAEDWYNHIFLLMDQRRRSQPRVESKTLSVVLSTGIGNFSDAPIQLRIKMLLLPVIWFELLQIDH